MFSLDFVQKVLYHYRGGWVLNSQVVKVAASKALVITDTLGLIPRESKKSVEKLKGRVCDGSKDESLDRMGEKNILFGQKPSIGRCIICTYTIYSV